LSVEDDGQSIPPGLETAGMGLRIMGFRANMIHAALDIQSPEARQRTGAPCRSLGKDR
jgi:signal transduction histidine kinase